MNELNGIESCGGGMEPFRRAWIRPHRISNPKTHMHSNYHRLKASFGTPTHLVARPRPAPGTRQTDSLPSYLGAAEALPVNRSTTQLFDATNTHALCHRPREWRWESQLSLPSASVVQNHRRCERAQGFLPQCSTSQRVHMNTCHWYGICIAGDVSTEI